MMLSAEEKKKILKALEEDAEFRYAIAGLIGYREILERFSKLEEGYQELRKGQQRLEERIVRLEERILKLEEGYQELRKGQQRLEERIVRLEEGYQELKKGQQELRRDYQELRGEVRSLKRTVDVIAHRFGVISERSFREGMREVLEEELGTATVTRLTMIDESGVVYGHPSEVEVDVLVKDGKHILVEVKSRVSKADVAELHRIGLLYEKKYGIKPVLLIIGGIVDESAKNIAKELKVKIRPVVE